MVTGICLDSREVKPGNIFVALKGGTSGGHLYISDAINRGCAAIIGSEAIEGCPLSYVRVEDGRLCLARLAAAFYDFPARQLTMIGVTGTDGKTTTCNLIFHILTIAGFKVGMITTVNAVIGESSLDTGFHVTTPESPDVQLYLSQMVAAGAQIGIIETTSHGLDQKSVAECEFDIGVVTNITHEHMDEHGSYENYRAAKARLFASLEITRPKPKGNPRLAVINRDDVRSFGFLNDFIKVKKINYGFPGGNQECPRSRQLHSPPGPPCGGIGNRTLSSKMGTVPVFAAGGFDYPDQVRGRKRGQSPVVPTRSLP